MKVALTGASGFLGGAIARCLTERGDVVIRLGRRETADDRAATAALAGADALVHCAGVYEIGISRARRHVLQEGNVDLTARVLGAARTVGLAKVVYVSTVAVFGDTHGATADEKFVRTGEWTSYYDRTKTRAHTLALEATAGGLPLVIVQPGQIFGPGDHSGVGAVLARVARGRLPLIAFDDLGLSYVHVDDCAAGAVLALATGRTGESYILGGPNLRLGALVTLLAGLAGHRPPLRVPAWPLRPFLMLSPALRELRRATDRVTYFATSAKAASELGWRTRDLSEGLRATFLA